MELGDGINEDLKEKLNKNIWWVLADYNFYMATKITDKVNEEIWEMQIIFPSRPEML